MRPLSALDQANELIRHLGDQVGLVSLSLDRQGRCLLWVGRRWALSLVLDASHDILYLSCPVTAPQQLAEIPPGAWMALLQTHHLGGRTHGASMAVDPEGRVCVQRALHLPEVLPAQLLAAVEEVIGRAGHWASQLSTSQPTSHASSQSPLAQTSDYRSPPHGTASPLVAQDAAPAATGLVPARRVHPLI